jgi:hypothetical protein
MYVYTWRSVIFSLFRMKTFLYVVILEVRENIDPEEEEFFFLLYKDLGCRFDKFPLVYSVL